MVCIEQLLPTLVAVLAIYPFATALILTLSPWRSERSISRIVFLANVANGLLSLALLAAFIASGFHAVQISYGRLLAVGSYHLDILLLVDKYSVAFQFLIALLTGIVLFFSRRYMHREEGYIRFFALLFLFLGGISIVALSATIDILFAGWEIVGISSFLLIGFYRMRLQPGRNSLRVYAIYRFCDAGLFLGAWLFHVLGKDYYFLQMGEHAFDAALGPGQSGVFVAIALLIVLAAMGKSAQYPFSFWVPRAMEGPTPSSAIFYGALSIHAGVYLLIRLFPLWHAVPFISILVATIGAVSAFVANQSLKSQSNIKAQIAYASISQVGLMFVELAFGWRELAMLHFFGNAILRCYQLLASPSVMVMYLRRLRAGERPPHSFESVLLARMSTKNRHRYFAFAFAEGYAETLVSFLWRQLKALARIFSRRFATIALAVLIICAAVFMAHSRSVYTTRIPAGVFGLLSLWTAFVALGTRLSPLRTLLFTVISALCKGVAVLLLAPEMGMASALYFGGVLIGALVAWVALSRIPRDTLRVEYAGAALLYPRAVGWFLVGCLWISGFTLSPTFFGDDLLLHFGAEKALYATLVLGAVFVLNSVTLMRSYVKLAFAR